MIGNAKTDEIIFTVSKSFKTEIAFLSRQEMNDECRQNKNRQIYVVDEKVYKLYFDILSPLVNKHSLFLFRAEEAKKNQTGLYNILAFLTKNKVTRNTDVIAVGGGITLDIAAFAASIFKRGCSLILVPTTYLAMVDAAVGGKTGINFKNYKNLLGSFYPARRVLVVRDFLESLQNTELMNGWAECIKVSLLTPNKLYDTILETKGELSDSIIRQAIDLKINFCRNDLFDTGKRQILNLGHTVAHLIESVTDFRIPHGIAVSLGIRVIARYSREKGYIDDITEEKLILPLNMLGFPQSLDKKYHKAVSESGSSLLEMDKKNNRKPRIVVFTGFQKTIIRHCNNYTELLNCLLSI